MKQKRRVIGLRRAKQRACFHAANVIDSALGAGWDIQESGEYSLADASRIYDALNEIVQELRRRASGRAPSDGGTRP